MRTVEGYSAILLKYSNIFGLVLLSHLSIAWVFQEGLSDALEVIHDFRAQDVPAWIRIMLGDTKIGVLF